MVIGLGFVCQQYGIGWGKPQGQRWGEGVAMFSVRVDVRWNESCGQNRMNCGERNGGVLKAEKTTRISLTLTLFEDGGGDSKDSPNTNPDPNTNPNPNPP